MQLPYDKFGMSSYSEIQIKIPLKLDLFEQGRSSTIIGQDITRFKNKEIVLNIINNFIEKIKFELKLFWIEKIRYQDIIDYNVDYWNGTERIIAFLLSLGSGVGATKITTGDPFYLPVEKVKKLKQNLTINSDILLSEIFLLNSLDAFLKEDFRLSIIEVITALEITLSRFYKLHFNMFRIKNVDSFLINTPLKKKFEKILSYLKIQTGYIDSNEIKNVFYAIDKRNMILHEGFRNISALTAEKSISSISLIIKKIKKIT